MTARTLAQAPPDGVRWPWLTSAAEMAATTPPGLLGDRPRRPSFEPCFPRVATRTPDGDLASVAAGRRFARSTLQRWGLAARCDDITLVVSELLANAVHHARPQPGGWPVRFGLLQLWPGSAVLCAVADPSPAPPVPGPQGQLSETGRGLHVVDELADCWGYTAPGRLGKVVWATFDVGAGLAAEQEAPADPPPVRRPRRAAGRHRLSVYQRSPRAMRCADDRHRSLHSEAG